MQVIFISALLVFALCFSSQINDKKSIAIPIVQTECLILLMILGLVMSSVVYGAEEILWFCLGLEMLLWDDIGYFQSILLCVSVAGTLSLGLDSLKRFSRYEFLLLIWLTVLGILCLIKSFSFLGIYLSIELQTLSSFMLAAM